MDTKITHMSLPFFFGPFHAGVVNRLLHSVGYLMIVYGMWTNNWLLAVLSLSVAEIGHIYNHQTRLKGKTHLHPLNILVYQTILSSLLLLATYIGIRILKGS